MRQEAVKPLRPFDQARRFGEGVLQAQFPRLLRPLQSIKIDMPKLAARALIGLHQGVGRAWRLLRLAGPCRDRPARQCRLARSQAAAEAHDIAARELGAEARPECKGRCSVAKSDFPRIKKGL